MELYFSDYFGGVFKTADVFDFYYIDVWSSPYSWNGSLSNKPRTGDLVVIPKGQTILIDEDVPGNGTGCLSMFVIQGMII